MLEWPSSHCHRSHRTTIKFFAHSFFSSFFCLSWEDTSLENPLRLLFKGPCVAGWQRTPLCLFSHLERPSEIEKGVLSSTSAWVDSLARFSDLPCLCDTRGFVRGWQRTGSPGVGRARLKVSSISLCVMGAGVRVTWRRTEQDGPIHTPLLFWFFNGSFPLPLTHTNTPIHSYLSTSFYWCMRFLYNQIKSKWFIAQEMKVYTLLPSAKISICWCWISHKIHLIRTWLKVAKYNREYLQI